MAEYMYRAELTAPMCVEVYFKADSDEAAKEYAIGDAVEALQQEPLERNPDAEVEHYVSLVRNTETGEDIAGGPWDAEDMTGG